MAKKIKPKSPFCDRCPLYLARLEAKHAYRREVSKFRENCQWLKDEGECTNA